MYRPARFIWTPCQAIDEGRAFRVFLEGASRRDDGRNRFFLFRRRLELAAAPDAATLRIGVDGRYQLFVNGVRVGRGPARADPLHMRLDSHEIAGRLRAGANAIALLVRVYGIDTSFYETAKGLWQPAFGDGGLYVDGEVRCGSQRIPLLSDASWSCLECEAWEREAPRANHGLAFIEIHDASRFPAGFAEPGFDDSGWDRARELRLGGGPPESLLGGMRTEPFPTLLEREIPYPRETQLLPLRLLRVDGVAPQPELPVDRRLYAESRVPLPAGLVESPEALCGASGPGVRVRTRADLDVSLLFDFGRIHPGYPFVELEARGGELLEVAVAEGLPGEFDGKPLESLRLTRAGGHGAHVFRYSARAGSQRFEAFEWSAVRYLELVVRGAPEGVRIRRVGSLATGYPAEPRGLFRCSDPALERLWEVGRHTLQCCMVDSWMDCPGREQRQWLGDATVEFLVSQAAFGPSANALNRQFLLHAAESQRSDGLTQMFAPGDHRGNGLLIPDWTLQWILNADLHLLYTGDLATIEEVFPTVERALAWFARHAGPNDLLCDVPFWHFHDWAALGRHGEAAALNGLYCGALRAAARMAHALESERAARRYTAAAARVASALERRHWDARRGVYVDCVDPASGRQDPRVSQHANAAAILFGCAPRERWERIVARISDEKRLAFTAAPPIVPRGETLDLEEGVVLANTFFAHFVLEALAEAGRFDLALAAIRSRWLPMLARGATTLWESFEPTASLCHGFSTTPLFQLSSHALGVAPLADGFARLRVAPQPADLEWAQGVFPTVRGDVRVAWRRTTAALELELGVPDGAQAELVAPRGFALPDGAGALGPGVHRLALPATGASR